MTEDAPSTSHPGDELLRVAEAVHAGEVSVAFSSGPTVMAKVGDKLLDIAEVATALRSHRQSFAARHPPGRCGRGGRRRRDRDRRAPPGTPRRGADARRGRAISLLQPLGFFDGLPRSADVLALEPAEALVLTQTAFQRLRLVHPRVAVRFVSDLGRILGERFRASDALAGPAPR